MRSIDATPDSELTAALTAARIAVIDLLLFAGVDPDEARAATREEPRGSLQPKVSAPASRRKSRLDPFRRRLVRWHRRLVR